MTKINESTSEADKPTDGLVKEKNGTEHHDALERTYEPKPRPAARAHRKRGGDSKTSERQHNPAVRDAAAIDPTLTDHQGDDGDSKPFKRSYQPEAE